MTPHLLLIRGLPGSGKSTMAKDLQSCSYVHAEADMYFMLDGHYSFDATLITRAHEWCQSYVKYRLWGGDNVVVNNTFSRKWEKQPYLDMGYPVDVITATGNYGSVHGVPVEVIEAMRSRWEEYP